MRSSSKQTWVFVLGVSLCFVIAFASFAVQYKALLTIVPADGMGSASALDNLRKLFPDDSRFQNESPVDLNTIEMAAIMGMVASVGAAALAAYALFVVMTASDRGIEGRDIGTEYGARLIIASIALLMSVCIVAYSRIVNGDSPIDLNFVFLGNDSRPPGKWRAPFMHFQWDNLLVEVGALVPLLLLFGLFDTGTTSTSTTAALRSPAAVFGDVGARGAPATQLIRLLLVKLMFLSGIVKIQSNCPTWHANMTALFHHFATQPLPTPAAYWFHFLPKVILVLGVMLTYIVEIPLPLVLVLVPAQSVRRACCIVMAVFQIMIALSGNYTFFNVLTVVLCIGACIEDRIDGGDNVKNADTNSSSSASSSSSAMKSRAGETGSEREKEGGGKPKASRTGLMVWLFAITFVVAWSMYLFNVDLTGRIMAKLPTAVEKEPTWFLLRRHASGLRNFGGFQGQVVTAVVLTMWVVFGQFCISVIQAILADNFVNWAFSFFSGTVDDTITNGEDEDGENGDFLLVTLVKTCMSFLQHVLNVLNLVFKLLIVSVLVLILTSSVSDFDSITVATNTSTSGDVMMMAIGPPLPYALVSDKKSFVNRGLMEIFTDTSSYGLFRRMTGVDYSSKPPKTARPELIIEISDDDENYVPIEFKYKPGNVDTMPSIVAPHQPRVDWQMWFAALGGPQDQPWIIAFLERILQGDKHVLSLLKPLPEPWSVDRPPEYVRALMFVYNFNSGSSTTTTTTTRIDNDNEEPVVHAGKWWTRTFVAEYVAPIKLGNKDLEHFLAHYTLEYPKFVSEDFIFGDGMALDSVLGIGIMSGLVVAGLNLLSAWIVTVSIGMAVRKLAQKKTLKVD